MAIIYGVTSTGKNGVLSHDELTKLIRDKSGDRAAERSCGVCATHIEDMTSTAGQGGITTQYGGRTVYHISSGRRGGGDGCSVFFTLSQQSETAKNLAPGKQPAAILVAGIVGVGWHAGGDTTYDLDWGKGPPFFTGGRFESTVQHQASA